MAVKWTVRCYVSPRGENIVRVWYDDIPAAVRGKFLSRLRTLVQLEPHEWKMPLFRWLHGDCVPLGEIRFEVGNVQHRPLGYQQPGRTFTLVICAEEKGGKLVPPSACATGLARKAEVESNAARAEKIWLTLE